VSLSVGAMEESPRGWQDVAVESELQGVCRQLGDSLLKVGFMEPCGVGAETLGEEEEVRCLARGCLRQGELLPCIHTGVVLEKEGLGREVVFGEVGVEIAVPPLEDCNLVEVRVVQGDYMVQNPVVRSIPILKSDNVFENCNKIFKLKNDVFEAAKIWSHGKEMGCMRSSQEDFVIRSLLSLESQDDCKLRNERGSPVFLVFLDDEDN